MANIGLTILLSLFFTSTFFSQQLILNEVSQGTGSSEYVEFVVIGSVTCTLPVPCIDLRKVIIDDNNGYFASGTGTGIASGAVRFADNVFWSCVPQGTYIVIYNENSPNTNLPPDDISLTDGNCRLVMPASSNLLEGTTVNSPSTLTNLYPPNPDWSAGGSWAPLAMSNSDDSFQIPNLAINGTPLHAVSWGNNTNGSIIYFAGAATLKVFSFVNSISNDWNMQANWVAGDVGINETPGAANSPENNAWIALMNPICGVPIPISLSSIIVNESCSGLCDGSAGIIATSTASALNYLWQSGLTSQNITNLCPGTYSVIVSAADACPGAGSSISVTIQPGTAVPDATITNAGPFTIISPVQQLIAASSGSIWTSDCGSCLSASGIFDPQISGVGTFQICYAVGSGICSANDCITIDVSSGCAPQQTTEFISICENDSAFIFSNWENSAGNYSHLYTSIDGCDSTHLISLSLLQANPVIDNLTLCEKDSIFIGGSWIHTLGTYTVQEQNNDGCFYDHITTLVDENCPKEEMVIYIPNAITPNNDGINDIFKIEILGGIVESGFILDRWGHQIATFSENKVTWNGTNAQEQIVQNGVYTYVVTCFSSSEFRKVERGFVAVIR